MSFQAVLSGGKIYSNSREAVDLCSKSKLGEFHNGRVFYSSVEVLYLADKGKMHVLKSNKKIEFHEILSIFKRSDKRVHEKYSVFKDLRDKGYVVKAALKFGADFRVYRKSENRRRTCSLDCSCTK
jgi:tRNA-intron endonuclease